jgi:alkylation response protein AidB-like acyl-CoA dehydrogenase
MEITLLVTEEAFRLKVQTFLQDSLSPELKEGADKRMSLWQDLPSSMAWQQILHDKGWVAPDWPAEYGGTGWSVVQRHILPSNVFAATVRH